MKRQSLLEPACAAARALILMLSGCALTAGIVQAADEPAQGGARNESEIFEIVVTAQKRAENVQDVPITMQAYTGEQLKDAGVREITDIVKLAPNLNVVVQNALSQHIVIRGVGTNEFFGNAPSSVGTYMDEVTMNSSYMSTLGLFDMERVEVLRGPQNSLFGRNTTGGAVNYISVQPKVGADKIDGDVSLTYGSHNLAELEAGVSFPMGSTAALRLSGILHTRDGIWHNLDTDDKHYGDEDRHSLRATFVWEPSTAMRLTASYHSATSDGEAQPQKMAGALAPISATNPVLRINDLLPFAGNIDWEHGVLNTVGGAPAVNIENFDRLTTRWRDVWNGGSQRGDLNVDGGYVKFAYDFGGATLTSITSYDKTHGFYEEDNTGDGNIQGAGTPGVTHDVLVIDMDQEYKQFTQELRLASNDSTARLRWIAGLYYLDETSVLAQDIRFGDNGFPGAHPSAVGITPPALFDVIPDPYGNTVSFSIHHLEDKSYSAYGQIDFGFTEKLNLTVGLRYTKDDKADPFVYAGAFIKATPWDPSIFIGESEILSLSAGLPGCFPRPDPPAPPFFNHCADTETTRENLKNGEVGGKINLQYHVSDDVMIYGGYSRGFKSGKFDLEFLHTDDTPFPQRALDPETLDAFEVGFKSTLLEHSLIVNGAIFFNIWKDQQVFNVGVNGPEFFNLPESQIYGAELETSWVPAEHWLLSANLGFLHTELTDVTGIDFDVPQGTPGHGDFQKGHELPLSPEFSGNFSLERNFDLGASRLGLGMDYRYQSSSKVKFSPQVPIDEYTSRSEINARASLAFGPERQYELAIYGENLTGEKYCVEIQDLRGVSGSFYCVPNEGELQWSIQGRVHF
ncbi:MAG TPA: TonB-dependent receptor [Steroidobacteraceae bacterium]|nr:TonB-dependent receptor [Steroidobacteraceae bacterium]